MLAVIATLLLVGSVTQASQAAEPQQPSVTSDAPSISDIPLRLNLALTKDPPTSEAFAPNGTLWMGFGSAASGDVDNGFKLGRLVDVQPQTGQVLHQLQLRTELIPQLIIGPDGRLWFGGNQSNGNMIVGTVTSTGQIRRFTLPIPGVLKTIAAGSDDRIWFAATTNGGRTEVGAVDSQGRTKLKTFPMEGLIQGLLPAQGGGFWTALYIGGVDRVARLTTTAKLTLTRDPSIPLALGANGAVWGFADATAAKLTSLSNARVNEITWWNGESGTSPEAGTAVLGADDRIWFTGSSSSAGPSGQGGTNIADNDVIGAVGPSLALETWPADVSNLDGSAIGDGAQALVAGPDGRLYAIGYSQEQAGWHLFGIGLPDAVALHSATASLKVTGHTAHAVNVRVVCAGPAGRQCAGTLRLTQGKSVRRAQSYAVATGLQASYVLMVPKDTIPNAVSVTAFDSTTHRTSTRTEPLRHG